LNDGFVFLSSLLNDAPIQIEMSKKYMTLHALFAWLISHQPTVLFSQNKSATNNQPAVLFSQNKPAPVISHQPNEQAASLTTTFPLLVPVSDVV
jgi:hypothetical protein